LCRAREYTGAAHIDTRIFSLHTSVYVCSAHCARAARDSRARDNDNTAWVPRVYSPSKAAAQHARALWRASRRYTQRRQKYVCVCVCVCVCYARVYVPIAGVVWGMAIFLKNYRYSHLFKCARGRIDEYRWKVSAPGRYP